MGVFRDSAQPGLIDEFERWLGCDVEYVVDFPARNTWQTIAHPGYLVRAWEADPRSIVFSLAMLPTDEEATLDAGARGEYDAYFASFGRELVEGGRGDSIIRLAWEFNLRESRWFTPDPGLFQAYWRRIVRVLRGVEGQQFTFLWNPGRSGVDAVPYYPGDDVVDEIGVDVYDATGSAGTYPYPSDCDAACRVDRQIRAWNEQIYGGDTGLEYYSAFARSRGKPLTLPEWGLWDRPDGFSGGRNLFFIRRMHHFITDPVNDVAWHAYFEYDGDDGAHRLMTTFPEAGELFRALFVVPPEQRET
jgi:hypothetical protein